MKVAVFGASGYGGQVLMRLLLDHPEVDAVLPVSSSTAGQKLDERDQGLGPDPLGKLPENQCFLSHEEALAQSPDAVFSALPHGASAEFCQPFFEHSVVFDLSADFRLDDPRVHQQAYGATAPFPELRKDSVYGLAEINDNALKTANLVAVPGCYPTCILLPLLPLAQAGIIGGPIVANAISGISGAGRAPKENSLYVERAECVTAYAPGRGHRHLPEMEQELAKAECHHPLFFTPHLAPFRRGMEATITVPLTNPKITEDSITNLYQEAYGAAPFIGLRGKTIPSSSDVRGSNRCDIGWTIHEAPNDVRMMTLFSVIDNLMKGASGQAVQGFNIRFGFPPLMGLPLRGET
ncbi:MAG: N-acetyl-gamma-glutamyl-phosphate reductase [Spirochaetales bacterium]|nr:N-acetyl-gamma-glutamyl-phosphate reductase [Spirochaetales bacterium]